MPKHSGTKKTKKAEGTPTGPRTGYMYFMMSVKDEMKQNHPNGEWTQLAKLIGTMWKELTDEEKKPYLEEAEDDKERHAAEVKEYEGGRIFPKKGKT